MSDPKFVITFVVSGDPVDVEVNPHQPLKVGRDKALKESGQEGRPPDEWEVRTEAGVPLDVSRKVEDLGIKPGTRLIVSLQAGAGGACSIPR